MKEKLLILGKEVIFSFEKKKSEKITQGKTQNEMSDFENFMREFIESELRKKFGEKWWKQGIPRDVRDKCKERREAEKKHFWKKHEERLFWYSDFDDLQRIMIRKDN